MRRLNRYIRKTVLRHIGMVFLVLCGLDVIASLLDQQENVFGQFTMLDAVIHVMLTLPGRLDGYMPFVVLIGTLMGLGALASSSELTVVRTSGVSTFAIVRMAMKPALWVVILALLVGEFVAPNLDREAESRRTLLQWGGTAFVAEHGLWIREGNEFINVNSVQPSGALYGVTVHRFDRGFRLKRSLTARRAVYRDAGWVLEKVVMTHLEPDHTERDYRETMRWDTGLTPSLLRILMLKPEKLAVLDLWSYARFLDRQGLNNDEYRLTFWQELLKPLASLSLVLVAVSIIFGPLREASMGFRLFVGIVIGLVFNTAQNLLGPSSMVFGFSPLVAVLVPILISAGVGGVLLRRAG